MRDNEPKKGVRATIHAGPTTAPVGATKDVHLVMFARRLQELMAAKGWNQSDLARAASTHAGEEADAVTRDNISKYVNAKAFPGPVKLRAIALALGVEKTELVPSKGITTGAEGAVPVSLHDIGDGKVWVRINQELPWPTAMKILEGEKHK
jgi:transcriptional regulator with XRE-family HTH domain